ncbi:MAG: transporter substrate-binding domain-containing protein, partial [Clostridia bacterium]|nr:transporter substrate-binding domain-containing protein [Clostridia bacterium]
MRNGVRLRTGRRHATIRLFAFLLCLTLFPACGSVAEATETVRVGYYENEVFQEGASPDAIKTGYAYEYYLKLSEYTGWKYEYIYGSYGELYQMLLDGRVDLLAGLAWKEERSGLIGYPDAAMGHETYSLVKHDAAPGVTADPATIAGKKIGVLDSAMVGVLESWLEGKGITADVVRFVDYAELFTAFDKNRVDILAAEGDGAYGREHAEVLCSFGASDYFLCVNIQRPDLLTELNLAQTQLAVEEPNYLHALNSKYYSVSVSSRAFSASEREWIGEHSDLKVGYLNNYLPYSGTDDQGRVTGIVQDMVPGILNGLGIDGITVAYRAFDSYDDMIAAVNDGSVDAVFPVGGGLYYSEENGIYQSSAVVS